MGAEPPIEAPSRRRSLAGDAAILAVGSLITQAAGLISVTVLARILSKTELGSYQQLLLIYSIVSPLLLGGVPAALLYFLPRAQDADDRRRWVIEAYKLLGAFGLAGAAGLFLLRHPAASLMGNEGLDDALALYAPSVFFTFVTAVMPNALIASGHAHRAAKLGALTGVIWLVSVVTSAAIRPDAESVALGITIGSALTALIATTSVARTGVIGPARTREVRWRPLLGYGLPLAMTGIVGMLGFQLDRLIVSANFSPDRFAVYAVGAIEVPLALLIRQSVNSVLVPALSERHAAGDHAGMIDIWIGAIRKTSLLILPMFTFFFVLSHDVIVVLFGERYEESAGIFRVYLFLLPLNVATWGLIPMATGHTRTNVIGSLVLLAFNGGFAVALVGPLGLYGPAMATPLAAIAVTAFFLWRIRVIVGFRVRDVLPWGSLLVDLSLAIACALPLLGVVALDLPSPVRLLLGLALFLPLTVTVLRMTRRVDDDDWRRLTSRLRRGPLPAT